VLGGDSSYSGGTTVEGGALTLATSTAAGTGAITLLDDTRLTLLADIAIANALAIRGNAALAVAAGTATASGAITGDGDLALDGAGTLVLGGDGSGYTGDASLSNGTLVVDGSLGGSLGVSAGGTLAGNGTVGDTVVGDGGTVSPSQLTVDGDVTFGTGSTLQVGISGSGENDSLQATGLATLDGGLLAVVALDPAISYSAGQSYAVLTADGGVTGRFDGTSFSSVFLDARLSYDANTVVLTVTPDNPRDTLFADVAATVNQRAAATALDGFEQTAGSDAIIVYNQLLFSASEADARRAFDLSSGEVQAGLQTAIAGSSQLFTDSLRDRAGLVGGTRPYAPPTVDRYGHATTSAPLPTSSAWGGTMAESFRRDGDGNAARLSADTAGVLGGAEFGAASLGGLGTLTAGFGFGFSRTDADIDARLSEADIESSQVGLYAALENGPVLLNSAISYGHHTLDTSRHIAFGTIDRLAEAGTSADSFSYAGEAQIRVPLGGLMVTPLATLNFTRVLVDGTTEAGAGALNLATDDSDYSSGDVGVGLALGYGWSVGSGRLRSEIRAAYERGFGDTPEQTLSFLGGPTRVAVLGADGKGDRLAIGIGFGAELGNGLVFSGRYDGTLGSDGDSHGGHVSAGYRF
jgi:autotransporter-associated beta strand protein